PGFPFSNANKTSSTASSKDIRKRVILGSVIVNGLPDWICFKNKGITDPLDAMTLPYRVKQTVVLDALREAAIATFSIKAFEIPIALIGYAALSVLRQIILFTLLAIAASIVFCVPKTFVLVASMGKNSQEGTCFNAAA